MSSTPSRALRALLGVTLCVALAGCGTDEAVDAAPTGEDTGASSAPDESPSESAGEAPSESPSATPEPTTAPVPADAVPCADVWQEGARLPRGYDGCLADGAYVERDATSCSSGQFLVTFDDRFYGVLGGDVIAARSPLRQDAAFRRVVRSCTA